LRFAFASASKRPWMRDIKLLPRALGDGVHVLVAPAGKVDEADRVLPHRRRHFHRLRHRVRRLERRNDAFAVGKLVERASASSS